MPASIDDRILEAIRSAQKDGLTGGELWKSLGWWRSLGLYPSLMRLERKGMLRSAWVDGPYPRRRLYHLTALSYRSITEDKEIPSK